jgi:hypothetical protein
MIIRMFSCVTTFGSTARQLYVSSVVEADNFSRTLMDSGSQDAEMLRPGGTVRTPTGQMLEPRSAATKEDG